MKMVLQTFKKITIYLSMVCLISGAIQTPVMAEMVGTEELSQVSRQEMQRDELRNILGREDVMKQLLAHGVSADDVSKRLDNLTDNEVRMLSAKFDELPAGEGFLGAVIAVIVIFMLLDIAGVTDVFPRI